MINTVKSYQENLMMNTKQISSVLGKSHSNIKISAERLAEKGTIALQGFNFEHNGNMYKAYNLTKRDSIILVAQNSPEFTAAIVDRWQELENKNNDIPQTYSAALLLAGQQAEKLEKQAEQLALAAPKVEFANTFSEATGNKTFRQVAKILKANEREFRAFLYDYKYMYQIGGGWTAHQRHVDTGRFHVSGGEANGHAFITCKFTPKGIEYIGGKWLMHANSLTTT